MKVLFVNTNPDWGGGEHWHCENALGLARKGHEVIQVAHPGGRLFAKLSGKIPLFPFVSGTLSWLSPLQRQAARRLLLSVNPDVVLVSLPSDAKLFLPVAQHLQIARRVYRRGLAVPVKNSLWNQKLYGSHVTALIVNSIDTKKAVLQRNASLVSPSKIHLIYNGVKKPEPGEKSSQEILRTVAGESNGLKIFHAGRLTHQKGQLFLLDVCAELKSRGIPFTMVIAGDGELKRELGQAVARLQLGDRVHMVGFQSHLYDFYEWCDVFAMPSRFEGFGFVAVEAMLMHKPVVAADTSSLKEIVQDRQTGRLVEFGNVTAFADALMAYADASVAKRHGDAGSQRARDLFSFEHALEQLEKVLSHDHPDALPT